MPGVCNRRVSILREISPTLLVTGTQVSGVPKGGVVVAPRSDAGSEGSAESYPKKQTDGGRHAQRGKANLDAAVAAKVAAADQAVALSAALTEEDQAVRAGSRGKKPLFTSHHAVNVQAKEEGSGTEGEGGREEPANIVVVSRCRPLLLREIKRGVRAAVFCDGDEVVVKDKALPTSRWRRFGFDRVFGEIVQASIDRKPFPPCDHTFPTFGTTCCIHSRTTWAGGSESLLLLPTHGASSRMTLVCFIHFLRFSFPSG